MDQQSTHWYKSISGRGYTSDPRYAMPGEVEKEGLHSCVEMGCSEMHGGSKEWLNNDHR